MLPLTAKVDEIRRDVKALLAAHNCQQRALTAVKLAYGIFAAGLALAAKWAVATGIR
jgi:hypothetical protein